MGVPTTFVSIKLSLNEDSFSWDTLGYREGGVYHNFVVISGVSL